MSEETLKSGGSVYSLMNHKRINIFIFCFCKVKLGLDMANFRPRAFTFRRHKRIYLECFLG